MRTAGALLQNFKRICQRFLIPYNFPTFMRTAGALLQNFKRICQRFLIPNEFGSHTQRLFI